MTHLPDASPGSRRLHLSVLGGLVLLQAWLAVSQAQMTLDGSLGPRGPLAGPHYRIGPELGQIRGGNLFHSFEQFDVPTGGSATFTGPNTIANILSRVTGGQPSSIDGILRSEIAGANLYLLNPSGVLFGPHASLAVSGSFHVSTADSLRFTDGATFFANLGQASTLTVADPAAFRFLGHTPAAITIQGSRLQVRAGNALSVVGGDLEIVGSGPLTAASVPTLGAAGGRVQLASVASPGEVVFSPLTLAPDLQVDRVAQLGQIALSQGAFLDASGNGGGIVLLRSGHLRVNGSRMFANNTGPVNGTGLGVDLQVTGDAAMMNQSLITTDSLGGRASDLRLTAGNVHLDESLIGSRTGLDSRGDGGNLEVRVGRLTLTGGARISSSISGPGRGGELTVVATDKITIAGVGRLGSSLPGVSGLFTSTSGPGDAGRLFVSAPLLTMDDGVLSTRALAPTPTEPLGSRGDAGSLEVRVGRLTLTGGAQISSNTSGPGRGGELTVVATDMIAIAGRSLPGVSGLSSSTSGPGNAGRLFVSAPLLTMDDGVLSTRANPGSRGDAGSLEVRVGRLTLTGGAQISSSTSGPGRGGTLTVAASEAITISGQNQAGTLSGLFSNTQGHGQGGSIQAQARTIEISDGGTISASSTGDGPAGTLLLQASETFRSERGAVTTEAAQAGGGAIVLRARRLVQLMDSEVTTTVWGGGGDAGNLTLTAPFVVADHSSIIANAFGGRGGNIQITADAFLADPTSLVSASSALGIQGTVNIQAPVTALSGIVAPLPQTFGQVAALLPARCAARFREGNASSMVLGGRPGLPAEPGGVLPSPLALEERLVADPVVIGAPHQQTSATKFALLTGQEKTLPRIGCPK
jgi:filamentous hemagglutinin family protein